MNTKLLSPKALKHLAEIQYSLEGKNGSAGRIESVNYALETLSDLEIIIDDPVTFITEVREGVRTIEKYKTPWHYQDDKPIFPEEDPLAHEFMKDARPSVAVLVEMQNQGFHMAIYLHGLDQWKINGYTGPWKPIRWMYIPK